MSGRAKRDSDTPGEEPATAPPAGGAGRHRPHAEPPVGPDGDGRETRARIIRGFSHDVKNPLGAADGYAQMLEDGMFGPLNAEQQRSIGRIRRSLHAALDLVNELAELARTDAGEIEIRREPVDARTIVREVVEENRARAESAGLTLTRTEPDSPVMADTDASRVRRVLGNLIGNALEYTERGSVDVTVQFTTWDRSRAGCVVIDVRDTGPGIPPEDQQRIFEEFARVGERGNGTGLGLAISRRIARALGGEITVHSARDAGATFRLWLPGAE